MEFCGLVHFGSVSHMGYLSQRDTLLALVNVSPELYWSIGTPPTPTPPPPGQANHQHLLQNDSLQS